MVATGALLLGIALAAVGGELFLRGIVGIASWARIPAGIIGATVGAFATSSPELSVAVNAALEGRPTIALGDALGSNLVNVGLVLGVALVLVGLRADRREIRRDLPVALLAPAVTFVLALDGRLDRIDGVVLLLVFTAWLTGSAWQAWRARSAAPAVLGEHRHGAAVLGVVAGLVALVLAGRFVVVAAKGIGDALGLDTFVVGATLVALGTSTPELATVVVSARRGRDEVGLGTVLGSNIFNNLWIVGLVVLLRPADVDGVLLVVLAVSAVMVAAVVPGPQAWLGRRRGVLLLAMYSAHLALLLALGA